MQVKENRFCGKLNYLWNNPTRMSKKACYGHFHYLNGIMIRQYNFDIQSTFYTIEDKARIRENLK